MPITIDEFSMGVNHGADIEMDTGKMRIYIYECLLGTCINIPKIG